MSQASRSKQPQLQQQPLDVLQGMVNAVLIETGKALHLANKRGLKPVPQSNGRLQTNTSAVIDKFHAALDELENDIVRAKAVLGRDLRELRERQYALDNPNTTIVEDASTTAEISASQDDAMNPLIEDTKVDAQDEPVIEKQAAMVTAYTPMDIKTEGKADLSPAPPAHESIEKSMQDAETTDGQVLEAPPSLDVQLPQADATTGLGISMPAENPPEAPAVNEASEENGLQSLNFDSMFETGGSGGGDLNFDDLDFSADAAGNQNIDFGDTHGEIDLSSFGDQVNTNNDDITAMLQGLDSYTNTSGNNDFNMLDLSNPGMNDQNNANNNTAQDDYGMSGGDLDMALDIGNNESAFDDLLDGIDFGDGADDGTGGETLEHGEFDDAFFGLSGDAQ